MTLPGKISSVLFIQDTASTLCGISLGDRFEALQLPSWWSDSHSDGATRYGWLDIGEAGISQMCCGVTGTLGRVSRVDFSLEIEDEAAEQAAFAGLREALASRYGDKGNSEKKTTTWQVPDGAMAGELRLTVSSFTMDGDRYYRVEGSLDLAPGVEITADARELFLDVERLADVLASKQWPRDRCIDALRAYFCKESKWRATDEERDAYRAMLRAARDERPDDVPSMIDRVCALMDWSDVSKGRDNVRATYVLGEIGGYAANLSTTRLPQPGQWLQLNPLDVVYLVDGLDLPVAERGAFAAKIIRAIEWGDAAAAAAVKERWRASTKRTTHLVWEAPDEIEARTFDLFTAHCADDDARVALPLQDSMYMSSCARACVSFFEHVRGLARPKVKLSLKQSSHSELDFAEYGGLLRDHFPAVRDAVLPTVVDRLQYQRRDQRAFYDAAADARSVDGGKTTWRIGAHVVTHTGDPGAGRYSLKKPASTAATTATKKPATTATKKTATKKTATKKAATKKAATKKKAKAR